MGETQEINFLSESQEINFLCISYKNQIIYGKVR